MLKRFAISLALLLLIPGCSSFNRHMTPAYRPQNVFVWGSGLPAGVRRVAVLPLICEPENADLIDGCEALEPIILQELAKTHRFEVSHVNQYDLCSRTGKSLWTCDETLPPGLFSWLADDQGCDAVLFCRLTEYRGYAPLAVGYRMRLVEIKSKRTIWAADDVFDAGQPAVQSGARQFQLAQLRHATGAPEEWIIQNSPRQFGEYAAAELFATLPGW